MQITDTIHCLRTPLWEMYTACYLITGEEVTLIDSGLPETWENVIQPYLSRIKRDPEEISLILHTHHDPDHVGSDQVIRALSGAQVAIHESGAEALERPERERNNYLTEYGKYFTEVDLQNIHNRRLSQQPLKADRLLRDREIVDLGSMKLEVIHTPGHTPDSVCFYDRNGRAVFTGDSIQGGSTICDDLIVLRDAEAYQSSIGRLMNIDLDLMLTAHPYLPYESATLRGSQIILNYLRLSADLNTKIGHQIMAVLKKSTMPMSAAEVSYVVCPVFRRRIPEGITHRTILTHLLRLAGEGKVIEKMGSTCVVWAPSL
jgi:hydroxyacylglutathione hydrolase